MIRIHTRLGVGLLGAALLLSTWSGPAMAQAEVAVWDDAWDDEEIEDEVPAAETTAGGAKPARAGVSPTPVPTAATAGDEDDDEKATSNPSTWTIPVTEQDVARSREYLEQGRNAFAMRYLDEAKAAYDKAIALNPDNADAYAARAELYYALGTNRRKKSLDSMEQATARIELEQSAKDATEALRLQPGDESLFRQRSNAYQALGRYDEALADITAAIKAKPDSFSLYDQRALIRLEQDQYDLALEDLYQALAINPRDRMNGYYRGLVFLRQGKYEEALAKFDEATSGGAWFADAWLQKGIVYEKLGRPLDALYAYRTFLSRDREHDAATIAFINERFNAIQLKKP